MWHRPASFQARVDDEARHQPVMERATAVLLAV